jgi:hypothetical protein
MKLVHWFLVERYCLETICLITVALTFCQFSADANAATMNPNQSVHLTFQNAQPPFQSTQGSSNFVLEVPGANFQNGMYLDIWYPNGGGNQNWQLTSNSDGSFRMHPDGQSSLCLDHSSASGTTTWTANYATTPHPGAPWYLVGVHWELMAQINTCNQSATQNFFVQKATGVNTLLNNNGKGTGEFQYLIRSVQTPSDCLNSSGDNAPMVIWWPCQQYGSGLNDRWMPWPDNTGSGFNYPTPEYVSSDTQSLSQWADFYAANSVKGVANIVAAAGNQPPIQTTVAKVLPLSIFGTTTSQYYTGATDQITYSTTVSTFSQSQFQFQTQASFSMTSQEGVKDVESTSQTFTIAFTQSQQYTNSQTQTNTSTNEITLPAGSTMWLATSGVNEYQGSGQFVIYSDTNDKWTTDSINATIDVFPQNMPISLCVTPPPNGAPLPAACTATQTAAANGG